MAYAPGTQFNIMGKQPSTGIMNPQAVQADIMTRKMRAARRKAIEMTRKYNKNPHKMSSQEVTETLALAQTYGYNVSQGKKKDLKASFGDVLQGVGIGAIDGALLGMIPNSWYENRRNKSYAKGGRIGGMVASMFVPAGAFASGGKAAITVAKAAKLGKAGKLAKYTTTAHKLTSTSQKLFDATKLSRVGQQQRLLNTLRQGLRGVKSAEATKLAPKSIRALRWAAKNLTTAGQAARAKRVFGALGVNAGVNGGRLGAWGDVAKKTASKGGILEKILRDQTLKTSLSGLTGGVAGQSLKSGLKGAMSNPLVQGGMVAGGAVLTPVMLASMLAGYGREGNNYDPYQEFLDQTQMSSLPQMPQMPTQ